MSELPRVLVSGSRGLMDYNFVARWLDYYTRACPPFVLVHGGAHGADSLAEEWAIEKSIETIVYPVTQADWDRLGLSAGHVRNRKMVDEQKPKLIVAFWDGTSPGTKGVIGIAEERGITLRVVRFQNIARPLWPRAMRIPS